MIFRKYGENKYPLLSNAFNKKDIELGIKVLNQNTLRCQNIRQNLKKNLQEK